MHPPASPGALRGPEPALAATCATRMRRCRRRATSCSIGACTSTRPCRSLSPGGSPDHGDMANEQHPSSIEAQLRERLERTETELRRLIDHVPDGIVVMRDGKFAYANAAAARILGYDSPSDL